jgi:hypothetical protein
MDAARRAALKAAYREMPTYYGVVRLTNMTNGKMFIASYPNLKNKELVLRAQLDDGRHPNAALQADWRLHGGEAFTFEVLEQRDASKVDDVRYAAKQLETQWAAKLGPYESAGYNRPPEPAGDTLTA